MRQVIKVKPELLKLIQSGDKVATTRLGVKTKYHLGQVDFVNSENIEDGIFGAFVITKLEVIRFRDINQDLAWLENYPLMHELENALIDIYGPIQKDDPLTVIYFEVEV